MVTPNKLDFFATPVIWTPDSNPNTFEVEVELMLIRAKATSDWLTGKISAEEYLDLLWSQGIDADSLIPDWVNGISYQ